jgi:hypothetical protein
MLIRPFRLIRVIRERRINQRMHRVQNGLDERVIPDRLMKPPSERDTLPLLNAKRNRRKPREREENGLLRRQLLQLLLLRPLSTLWRLRRLA